MGHLPQGKIYIVQSKRQGQQKWQNEFEAVPDDSIGYPDGQAQADAQAAFEQAYGSHTGGLTEYQFLACIEYTYEVRPV